MRLKAVAIFVKANSKKEQFLCQLAIACPPHETKMMSVYNSCEQMMTSHMQNLMHKGLDKSMQSALSEPTKIYNNGKLSY